MSSIVSLPDVKRAERQAGTQAKWKPEIEDEIKVSIRAAISSAKDTSEIFSKVIERFESFYSRPSTNITSLRRSTKQEKGQWWEHFCLMYLKAKKYGEVWLLGDLPKDQLEGLGLTRRDNGIDIIVEHENGYFAVQAKWRSNPHKKSRIQLTWTKLATFFALASRTGPYLKHIVMTNCHSIKRNGNKWKMDQTIARAGFEGCSREFWQQMAGLGDGYSLSKAEIRNDLKDEKLDSNEESKIIVSNAKNGATRDDTNKRQSFLDKLEAKSKAENRALARPMTPALFS
jgi:Restriction endonuclease